MFFRVDGVSLIAVEDRGYTHRSLVSYTTLAVAGAWSFDYPASYEPQ